MCDLVVSGQDRLGQEQRSFMYTNDIGLFLARPDTFLTRVRSSCSRSGNRRSRFTRGLRERRVWG